MAINLGNVVGLLRSTTAPAKKYVLWGKILNPLYPDIVELNYWDDVSMAWIPLTDPTTQYWLRPVIDVRTTAPGSPIEGDRYLIGASASGTWAGKDDQVATFKAGNWIYQIPLDGFIVSVRTLANSLYDYRGTYGAGGVWVLDDFSVPVAPGTYIPMTQKGQALGVAPLDSGTKISYTFIEGSTLPYTPLNPASWPPGLDNVWDGVEYLRLLLAGGGPAVPALADVLISGNDAGGISIINLLDPTNPQDAATKAYVDAHTPPDASSTVKGIMKLYTVTGTNTDGTMDQNSITTSLAGKVGTSLSSGKILVGNSIGVAAPVDMSQDATIDNTGVVSVAWANGYSVYDARYEPVITGGTTSKYWRGDKTFQTLDTLAVVENTNLYYTAARFNTAFSGKSTSDLVEGSNLYHTNARVISSTITGVSITGGSISGTDTVLQAFGKLQNQINGVLGGAIYQGIWNATTNSPTLASGSGTKGYYYVVSVAGSTNLDGITDWKIGDWAIFNGTTWDKVDNTDAVSSVNGNIGAVALTGTANRITISGANVFDIAATYVGQSSITTLGTIGIGVWQGTAIADTYVSSSTSWNTAYNRSGTSLTFTASTFTFTKQDASTLTASVPTFNQNTTGTAAAWTTGRTLSITGDLIYTSPSFDGTGNITAAGALGTNVVSNAKIRQSVGLSVIGNSTNGTANVADIVGTNNQILRVSGTALGFGSIDLSQSASVGSSILGIANGGSGVSTAFSNGSVIFVASGVFSQNNNNFYFASNILSVRTGGDFGGTDSINLYNQVDAYLPNSSQGAITTSGGTSGYSASSSRGTGASPTNLSDNDLAGGFSMWGYTNSAYTNIAGAFAYVTGSTSANLGGEYRIYTKSDGGSLTQRFTLDNAGRAKVNSGGMDIVGIGTTTGVTWQLFQSDGVTNIAKYLDNGAIVMNGTWTATGASQIGTSSTHIATSRATASDTIIATQMANTFNVMSTSINSLGLDLSVNYVQIGGISAMVTTVAPGGLVGMVVGTYNNVAPISTSGAGTGALFTVVVATSTTFTSFTPTTSGSGYKTTETVTFNASQFGGSSGSTTQSIRTVTGVSLGPSSTALRLGTTGVHWVDLPKVIDFYYNGVSQGYIGFGVNPASTATGITIFDGTSQNAIFNNANGAVFSKAVTMSSTVTMSGAVTCNSGITVTTQGTFNYTVTNGNNYLWGTNATQKGHINSTGALIGSGSGSRGFFNASGGVTTGLPSSYTVTTGGSGYTAGNKASNTGGTGNGAVILITVSAGAITSAAPVYSTSAGTGYTVGDVITISGGTSGTVTVASVDQFGSILGTYIDTRALTDATSNNIHVSYYSSPTYTLASSSASTWFGYYNPTYTSFGTGTKGGICIVPTGTVNGIGLASPTATLHIAGGLSRSSWTTTGIQLALDAATYTDTGTAGTRVTAVTIGVARPTFASTNAVTITDAATVYIANDVIAGTNVTLTRTHALWVAAGLARFDGGIRGSSTNDAASTGNYGEELHSVQSTYTNYTTTATYQNIVSITLTAGDWDISVFGTFSSNTATITAAANATFVVSTTTASAAGSTEGVNIAYIPQAALLGTSFESVAIPRYRVSIAATTTYYLNSQASFTLGNPQFVGSISARRIR